MSHSFYQDLFVKAISLLTTTLFIENPTLVFPAFAGNVHYQHDSNSCNNKGSAPTHASIAASAASLAATVNTAGAADTSAASSANGYTIGPVSHYQAFTHYSVLYTHYLNVYSLLESVYDQSTGAQQRRDVKIVFELVISRMMQCRAALLAHNNNGGEWYSDYAAVMVTDINAVKLQQQQQQHTALTKAAKAADGPGIFTEQQLQHQQQHLYQKQHQPQQLLPITLVLDANNDVLPVPRYFHDVFDFTEQQQQNREIIQALVAQQSQQQTEQQQRYQQQRQQQQQSAGRNHSNNSYNSDSINNHNSSGIGHSDVGIQGAASNKLSKPQALAVMQRYELGRQAASRNSISSRGSSQYNDDDDNLSSINSNSNSISHGNSGSNVITYTHQQQQHSINTIAPTAAALSIQRLWRGYSERRHMMKQQQAEDVFIGLLPAATATGVSQNNIDTATAAAAAVDNNSSNSSGEGNDFVQQKQQRERLRLLEIQSTRKQQQQQQQEEFEVWQQALRESLIAEHRYVKNYAAAVVAAVATAAAIAADSANVFDTASLASVDAGLFLYSHNHK